MDDTGFPKKGQHSVGVAHQYCGTLGKQANCQVAVTITLANEAVSVPAAYQWYLPENWARDARRRRAAKIPKTVIFRPKWQIALQQILALHAEGVPRAPVVADAGYGVGPQFRDELTARGIPYLVGVREDTKVWPPGVTPRPPGGAAFVAARRDACKAPRANPPSACRRSSGGCPSRLGPR